MANIFNNDFQDFINAFNNWQVEYILVGGYSVVLHGYPRTTGDMDIWVNKTAENYKKIVNAFLEFGMPVFDMTEENFLNKPEFDVFTFGRPPVSIDIMTQVKGLDFTKAYKQASNHQVDDLSIKLIHLNDLINSKKQIGRPRDINDVQNLANRE